MYQYIFNFKNVSYKHYYPLHNIYFTSKILNIKFSLIKIKKNVFNCIIKNILKLVIRFFHFYVIQNIEILDLLNVSITIINKSSYYLQFFLIDKTLIC